LHVLGNAYYVQLGNADDYSTEEIMNQAIWDDLVNNQGLVNWQPYDLWEPVDVNGVRKFKWGRDGYVDMIYKIHKTKGRGPIPQVSGIASLTYQWLNFTTIPIDPFRDVSIKYGYGQKECSGISISFTPNENLILSVAMHEHGHYFTSEGHITYGKVVAGPGGEGFLSPYEMILLGYMSPTTITFNNFTPYNLKDYSARDNSEGHILKVPIATAEYFLITNRGNFSKWDKLMLGDTARINTFDVFNELGSGVYIYHVNKEISIPNTNEHVQDLECADGLWSFEYDTQVRMYAWDRGFCFNNGIWNVYKRNQVIYNNDKGKDNPGSVGDDKSSGYYMWAWKGQAPQDLCNVGTERLYTNDEDYFAFDQLYGDRFDPWEMEYNEVFSPYSSPNTNTWMTNPTNQNSWIFIVLRGKEVEKSINIDILKVDETHTLASILAETPPSRPLDLEVEITDCVDGRRYPRLTWHHNMEPDMVQGIGISQKRYKIFRAWSAMEEVPGNFEEIDDVLVSASGDYAEYIDYETFAMCENGTPELNYRLRYKVKAVDIYEDISVYSDFVSISTYYLNRGGEGGDAIHSGEIFTYELKQNYPNPFNPFTSIQFQIVNQGMVSLKVYDMLGREVKVLVNEIKSPGKYVVSFDATGLSSGVYFYKMTAGEFTNVKRMVLVK